MVYFKLLAALAFFIATSYVLGIASASCNGRDVCSPFEMPPCGDSTNCRCIPWGLVAGQCITPRLASVAKRIEDHPNLCQSNEECFKKGSGDFCARYPNPHIDYGWCINSSYSNNYEDSSQNGFLKMMTTTL
ncbi:unnamed protein product [Cuscuta epithymum]|uniref:Albumin I chain a domain-containing protein n=1 Tax=Cuscuta epithymum TaxID=186058 RepID=A0AAV0EK45_9ASTE|nr:unnamed protein product [Cuscuta epithymum]